MSNAIPGDCHVPAFRMSGEKPGSDSRCVANRINVASDQLVRARQAQTERQPHAKGAASCDNGVAKPMLFIECGCLEAVHDAASRLYETPLGAPLRTSGPVNNLAYDRSVEFARLLFA